nr:glycoside hydrolase family 92 protein [Chitinophagaceae bacterium]
KLDSFFSMSSKVAGHKVDVTGFIGQYAHGNEPSHHIAYLYNYVGRNDKTRRMVQMIADSMYRNQPDGYPGNEDCGQMSAWYVFSAMGFYPVNPASGRYDLGVPLVSSVVIKLPNGNTFSVRKATDERKAARKGTVWLNGQPLKEYFITWQQIQAGGELVFY